MRLRISIRGHVRPSVLLSVRPSIPCYLRTTSTWGLKVINNIITNDTMSDDREITSDLPRGTYLSLDFLPFFTAFFASFLFFFSTMSLSFLLPSSTYNEFLFFWSGFGSLDSPGLRISLFRPRRLTDSQKGFLFLCHFCFSNDWCPS